jgi:flagellar motor switch protein FliG
MDKRLSQSVLESLQERNPGLEEAIRQKMFTFEDLAHLDGASLQRVMREVDLRDLALALKYSGESLQNILLGCISKRAAETVREEISYLGAVRMREVEAAQLRVVAVVRMLEAEGEIDLGGQEEPVQEKAA